MRLSILFLCMPFWAAAQTEVPAFSKAAGFYSGPASITLTAPAGFDIRYTTNGDTVTQYSKLYPSPLLLSKTTVLRARCYPHDNSAPAGPIVTQTFLINENVQLPVVSLTVAPYHLWDENVGIYVEGDQIDTCNFYPFPCANYWQRWTKPAFFEYFDQNKQRTVAQNTGIEITGGWSKANPKKGILVQFDHDIYGGGKVKNWPLMPDKPNVTTWKNLHLRPGGNGANSQFAHDAWIEKAVKETHNDYIAYQPAHLFLNGEYWGIYELRERQDKHCIRYNYGIDDDSVDVIRFPQSSDFYGQTNYYAVQAGSDSIWQQTVRRMKFASPYDVGFYTLADTEFDLDNYIDYYIVETFIGNNDWLGPWFNNIRVWRPQTTNGKWRYMLWDLDGSLGEQWDAKYTPCFDNIQYARHPDGWAVEHSWIFDKMCLNPQFRKRFAQRYAELLNTILTPEHLTAVANEIRSELSPDIARNFQRWGGDKTFWQQRFDTNIGWARQRRNCISSLVAKAAGLQGAVSVSVEITPRGAGQASLGLANGIASFWSGIFFKDFEVPVAIEPAADWVFIRWSSEGEYLPQPDSMHFKQQFNQNTKLTAHFMPKAQVEGFADGAAIYPNPATDWVYVQSATIPGDCSLYDAMGRLVRTFPLLHSYGAFSVEDLPAGVYTLRTAAWTRKVLIGQ